MLAAGCTSISAAGPRVGASYHLIGAQAIELIVLGSESTGPSADVSLTFPNVVSACPAMPSIVGSRSTDGTTQRH